MSYYNDIYLKRLNRYGTDYQTRTQGKREREFDDYLKKSVYRIDFTYDGIVHPGTLEPYKQDETETQGYLLTKVDLELPGGTIVWLPNKDNIAKPWLIWWQESMKASGYNRYVILRLSHCLSWKDKDNVSHTQWAYFYGPGTARIQDTVKSRVGNSVYAENNNLYMFITSTNATITKDTYFEVDYNNIVNAYRVTDYDMISTIGVSYISVDPIYLYDHSEKPVPQPGDNEDDFYWLNGGNENGST